MSVPDQLDNETSGSHHLDTTLSMPEGGYQKETGISQGGYQIIVIHAIECYCGFTCRMHTDGNDAILCIAAHRLSCEWTDHQSGVEHLHSLIDAAAAAKFPF